MSAGPPAGCIYRCVPRRSSAMFRHVVPPRRGAGKALGNTLQCTDSKSERAGTCEKCRKVRAWKIICTGWHPLSRLIFCKREHAESGPHKDSHSELVRPS